MKTPIKNRTVHMASACALFSVFAQNGHAADTTLLCRAQASGNHGADTQEFLSNGAGSPFASAANPTASNSALDADGKMFIVEHNPMGVVMGIGDVPTSPNVIQYTNVGAPWSAANNSISESTSVSTSGSAPSGTPGLLSAAGQPIVLANTVAASLQCVSLDQVTGVSNFTVESVSGNFSKDKSDDGDSILIQPSGYKWTNTGSAN